MCVYVNEQNHWNFGETQKIRFKPKYHFRSRGPNLNVFEDFHHRDENLRSRKWPPCETGMPSFDFMYNLWHVESEIPIY